MKNETTLPSSLNVTSALEAVFAAAPDQLGSAVESFLKTVLEAAWICGPIARVVAWTGDEPSAENGFLLTDDGAFSGFFFDQDGDRFGFYLSEAAGRWTCQFSAG